MNRGRRQVLLAGALLSIAGEAAPQAGQRVRRLGYLTRKDDGAWLRPLLAKFGHVEGVNLQIVTRMAESGASSEAAADELIREKVDALLTFGDERVHLLWKRTKTIPIMAGDVSDPVALGVARTLRRPGGNVTGISYSTSDESETLLLGILKRLRPRLRRLVVVLVQGREGSIKEVLQRDAETWARVGVAMEFVSLGPLGDYERAFAGLRDPDQIVVQLTAAPREVSTTEVAAFFRRARIATYGGGGIDWVRAGALMSFERTFAESDADKVGGLLDKLLRGGNPAEIPFLIPDRTEFALNRTTARVLRIEVPPDIQLRVTDWID